MVRNKVPQGAQPVGSPGIVMTACLLTTRGGCSSMRSEVKPQPEGVKLAHHPLPDDSSPHHHTCGRPTLSI
jgi:hypothetical protein